MDRLRKLLQRQSSTAYEPVSHYPSDERDECQTEDAVETNFSWIEYSIFLVLGIAMLWAWNMFLAAAPYFQRRFKKDDWLLAHFQSAIMSNASITNLGSVLILTKLQSKAAYPKRIISSLVMNILCFTLLALSTVLFRGVTPQMYFAFLMIMVFLTSWATGLCQNGVFSYVQSLRRGEYTQAVMTGQAIAGVLPCIAQIIAVLSAPQTNRSLDSLAEGQESSKSAFVYFLTATGVSSIALVALLILLSRHRSLSDIKTTAVAADGTDRIEFRGEKTVSMFTLFNKLYWLALALFVCFTVTMVFPVFTQAIFSVRSSKGTSRIFEPAPFISLAFLFWNAGDLLGRLLTLIPSPTFVSHPQALFFFSCLRILFIPLYLICNLHGRGAVINSDLFYLFVVQLGFGTTNGWLGSTCMMGASQWVEPDEREAAGGFMGLVLVAGLMTGSLLSFLAARA